MADQTGSSSTQDPFEMFRRLWAPLGLPVPGMAMPTLDPAEVEKRIADLRSVETWLAMNLNMVKMAIQGLEVQKMALNAMKANAGAAADAAGALAGFARNAGASPPAAGGEDQSAAMAHAMMWPWAMMQGAAATAPPGSDSKAGKDSKEGK